MAVKFIKLWAITPCGRNGHHVGNHARHKNPYLCAKTAPISGGNRGSLLIDVPIVLATLRYVRKRERNEGGGGLRTRVEVKKLAQFGKRGT